MPTTFAHGYALLIGVGQSAYAPWSLPVTVNDANAIRAALTDPSRCAYPDDSEHIRLLHDTAATRQAMLDGLAWLRERVATDSAATAVVYYSGHGWLDAKDTYYLIAHDVDPFNIAGSALAASDFTDALSAVRAERLLAIMDCCHAEGMAVAKSASLPPNITPSALPKSIVADLKRGSGRAVFTSSRGQESSWVRSDNTMSIYTAHLLEALAGSANRPGDEFVRLSNLMNYLGQAVPASAHAIGQQQTPFFDTAAEDFAVALVLGGKGITAPEPGATPATITQSMSSPSVDREVIDIQLDRLVAERDRLANLLLQEAKLGSAYAPPSVSSGIREARRSIARIKQTLEGLGVIFPNHPDDTK